MTPAASCNNLPSYTDLDNPMDLVPLQGVPIVGTFFKFIMNSRNYGRWCFREE
jgi:hypothetical protein